LEGGGVGEVTRVLRGLLLGRLLGLLLGLLFGLLHVQKSVDLEDSVQRDILQWEFPDDFYSLALEDKNWLRWISICSRSRVAYAFEDDEEEGNEEEMFVNVDNILDYLLATAQGGGSPLLLGSVVTDSHVVRDAGSKHFDGDTSCAGVGFVMSREVMRLQAVSGDVPKFPPRRRLACTEPASHQGLGTPGVPRLQSADTQACSYRDVMSVHPCRPARSPLNTWRMLTDPTTKCARLH
ncbi:acetylgalactosaminyl-O-glycosyl-glycoprotein beta-1,3-N-acetylglucosaminyltransferase-like, partial [Petromyzon marinus]|uniref:acetylgalactosaminyl-O-glycosyl-glycoprotein beta-1,3-N-acetylglucosaminyltransferase-like n=1 Tax=Petromyzon marinus TaxID=7757 RepID=UPI003F72AFD9